MVMRRGIARTTPPLAALGHPLTFRSLTQNEAAPPSNTPKTPRSSHQSATIGIKARALAAPTATVAMPAGRVGVLTWEVGAHLNPTFNPALPHNAHTTSTPPPRFVPSPVTTFANPLATPQFDPQEPVLWTPYLSTDITQGAPYLTQGFTQLEVQPPQPERSLHLTSFKPHLTSCKPHLTSFKPHLTSSLAQSQPQLALDSPPHVASQLTMPAQQPSAFVTTTACSGALVPAADHPARVSTPVDCGQLDLLLRSHPQPDIALTLVDAFKYGFNIGYTGPRSACYSPNLRSAYDHPDVVDRLLAKETQLGHVAGPFAHPPFNPLHCSGLGLVPKDTTDWRLIFHLSAPVGDSVNDHISPSQFTLHYSSVDDAIAMLHRLGPGALMAKADIKSAFRLCPVRPEDWPLLGMCWKGSYYYDTRLPFGLRSSPFLFNLLADALQWCLHYHYSVSSSFHYLDDYFFAGRPGDSECGDSLDAFLHLCHRLNIPLKPAKLVRPTTALVFLGIALDSQSQVASLPVEKLNLLRLSLGEFLQKHRNRSPVTKRQLLSVIGRISFAARVIPAGRFFVRRLLDNAHSITQLDTPLLISDEAADDMAWWAAFAAQWNGRAFFLDPTWSPAPQFELFTDASSEVGLGAYWSGRWLQMRWPPHLAAHSIQWKELFAIFAACRTWGSRWSRKRLLFHCDNLPIVHLWRSGMAHSPHLMRLLRALFLTAADFNFHVNIAHIPGVDNNVADALSRFQMSRFRALVPDADLRPTPIANLDMDPSWRE